MLIKSSYSFWDVNIKEIFQYYDLYRLYVKRNITLQYKQTIFGPLWFIIQPILTTIMYVIVFGKIAQIGTDGVPHILFYLLGICLWQYFADSLTKTSNVFFQQQRVFGKVYFPRIIVPSATVTSNLVKLIIQFMVFFLFYLHACITIESFQFHYTILLLPILVILLGVAALGIGMLFTSFTVKYRDLLVLFQYVVQIWMYATPIIYPLSTIPNETLQFVMMLNPLTTIFEYCKYCAFGVATISPYMLLYSVVVILLLFVVGFLRFNKVQRTFMDTI